MGRVKLGVKVISHHFAPVVDAVGKGGEISRQSAEVCDCIISTVSTADLAAVANGAGKIGTFTSEIQRRRKK